MWPVLVIVKLNYNGAGLIFKYEFQDETGTIKIELDDDQNWSHIQKDQLIDIHGEIDRDANSIKVDVKDATALER